MPFTMPSLSVALLSLLCFQYALADLAPVVLPFKVRDDFQKRSILRRADPIFSEYQLDVNRQLFEINATIGTPAQPLLFYLAVDIGDMTVMSVTNPSCQNNSLCVLGAFDSNVSSSYKRNDPNFSLNWRNDTLQTGEFGQDTVRLASVTVQAMQMALITNGSYAKNIMGIGYQALENNGRTYTNLPGRLYSQGLSNINGYSMWFSNGNNQLSGAIAFGGVDTGKFTGTLQRFSIAQKPDLFTLPLTGIATSNSSSSRTLNIPTTQVTIQSLLRLALLPFDVAMTVSNAIGFTYNYPFYLKQYTQMDNSTSVNFTLGDTGNTVTVSIPLTSYVQPYNSTHGALLQVAANYSGYKENVPGLGLPFLRHAYTVFDYTHSQILIAPLNEAYQPDNVTAIPVTGAVGLSGTITTGSATTSPVSPNVTAGATGSSSPSAAAVSHGLSTGAIAGIAVGAAVAVIAIAALLFMLLRSRRKHTRLSRASTALVTPHPQAMTPATINSEYNTPYKAELSHNEKGFTSSTMTSPELAAYPGPMTQHQQHHQPQHQGFSQPSSDSGYVMQSSLAGPWSPSELPADTSLPEHEPHGYNSYSQIPAQTQPQIHNQNQGLGVTHGQPEYLGTSSEGYSDTNRRPMSSTTLSTEDTPSRFIDHHVGPDAGRTTDGGFRAGVNHLNSR